MQLRQSRRRSSSTYRCVSVNIALTRRQFLPNRSKFPAFTFLVYVCILDRSMQDHAASTSNAGCRPSRGNSSLSHLKVVALSRVYPRVYASVKSVCIYVVAPHVGKYALNGAIERHHFPCTESDVDVQQYIHNTMDDIRHYLNVAVQQHTSIKWYATMDISFYRTTADGQFQQTTARFRTSPEILSDTSTLHPDTIAREFTSSCSKFQ